MKLDYLEYFKNNIKVKILEPYGKSSEKHEMECLICGSVFTGIPKDRKSKFKKHGTQGCPTCARKLGANSKKESTFKELKEMGYIIHSDYINNKTPLIVEMNNCCGRTWKAFPNKLLTQNPKCKPCADDRRLENKQNKLVKSRDYVFKQYIKELKQKAKLEVLPPYKTTNDHHDIKCLLCDGIFQATPKSKMNNYRDHKLEGCPKCTNSRRYTSVRESNIAKLKKKFDFIEPEIFTNDTMLEVTNKVCGHTFTSKVGNLLNREVDCPECGVTNRITQLQAYNEKINSIKRNNIIGFEGYSTRVRLYTERTYREYKNIINPKNLERKRSGSDEGYHLDHIVSIKECFLNDVPEELCAHPDNLRMVEWTENAEKWSRPQSNIPKVLAEYFPYHKIRKEFRDSFDNCDKGVEIISPYIFDLYDKKSNTGVIFHINETITESNVGKKYCSILKNKCEQRGIRVIQVFSDEWALKPAIVKSKIQHILGNSNTTRVYGRKTTLKIIDNQDKNEFLEKYHIQGADKSQINIGAFYDDKLVAVMTFCKPRVLMNKTYTNKEGYWELSRFATHGDYHVIGIASKLLKYFIRNYEWKFIYSFADLRWSSSLSNVYEQSGFTLDKKQNHSEYHYIIDGKRMHRWGFRKDALKEKFPDQYNPNETEYQNMLRIGYDRVWDCGQLKYIIHNDL
jgi:hypothetical protein